ncbi:AMP-binding protein [Gordonia sp. (in: high G+C Gram-positive bacteria)]|uniref:AMP-binding protein n=1 Tax=Gordonia sp. (in: high G+C Gram-positive bacteria) TaxID=84139 RepID=UPI003C76FBAD
MPNVIDPVRSWAATAPDAVAIRADDTVWTYGILLADALGFGASLVADGVAAGDRLVLAAPTAPEFVIAYLGAQAVGAIVVPVNTMATADELRYFLDDSGARLMLAHHALGPAAAQAAQSREIPLRTLGPMQPGEQAGHGEVPIADRPADETCALLYTSGTTGRPKGAQLTVGNLLAAGEIGAAGARGTAADRTGTGLPLFHVFGQASVMMSTFVGGGSLSLLARFDPAEMLTMLRRDRLTIMCGVPTMWNAMLHAASNASPADFASLRVAVSGGASLPGAVAAAFEEKFGCTLLEGYGLTETTAIATFNDIDRGGKIGSVGGPMPRMSVEVRDPGDGHALPAGEIGEVFVAGPTVTTGYWNRPDATATAITPDGRLRTGDLGVLDADGDLRIVDRLKDLIIHGGYNVYPGEVEEVLYRHPDIVEAAVIGIPDDHYGEQVAALIVTTEGSALDAAGVDAWTREHLSAYKIPRVVRFADALPKGSTGKILKRAIDRDLFVEPAGN